jgi:hypothetical protein
MGVPTSEIGYTSATTGRGDHEVHMGHVVALGGKNSASCWVYFINFITVAVKNNQQMLKAIFYCAH